MRRDRIAKSNWCAALAESLVSSVQSSDDDADFKLGQAQVYVALALYHYHMGEWPQDVNELLDGPPEAE